MPFCSFNRNLSHAERGSLWNDASSSPWCCDPHENDMEYATLNPSDTRWGGNKVPGIGSHVIYSLLPSRRVDCNILLTRAFPLSTILLRSLPELMENELSPRCRKQTAAEKAYWGCFASSCSRTDANVDLNACGGITFTAQTSTQVSSSAIWRQMFSTTHNIDAIRWTMLASRSFFLHVSLAQTFQQLLVGMDTIHRHPYARGAVPEIPYSLS